MLQGMRNPKKQKYWKDNNEQQIKHEFSIKHNSMEAYKILEHKQRNIASLGKVQIGLFLFSFLVKKYKTEI